MIVFRVGQLRIVINHTGYPDVLNLTYNICVRLLQMCHVCEGGNACERGNGQSDVEDNWLAAANCAIFTSTIYYNSGNC